MSKPLANLESGSTPGWLLNSKDYITGSKEWNSFIGELHDTIQQQLTESHVRQFTDLSESEKQLFMERATKALQGSSSYKTLYNGISNVLDHQLNGEVARQLLEEFPINTKSDMIVEAAKDGAVSILRKFPDFKDKLHACLNQPLPNKLREIAWKLFLDNPKVRKEYVDLLANNPRAAISSKDFEISQRCEQILSSEPTFHPSRGSIGIFYAMKAVLSYHHALKKVDTNLEDIDFMLCVPFIYVIMDRIPRREPAGSRIVALLVEEYQTYMRTRPRFMLDATDENENSSQLTSYARKVAEALNTHDVELARLISDMPQPDETLPPTPSTALSAPLPRPYSGDLSLGGPEDPQSLPQTPAGQDGPPQETGQPSSPQQNGTPKPASRVNESPTNQPRNTQGQNQPANKQGPSQRGNKQGQSRDADSFQGPESGPSLPDNIKELMRPVIRTMFVGYLNMDVVQYIWDQYVIGLDTPGYHHELLPALSAIFLLLLSDKLQMSATLVDMQEIMRKEGPKLKIEHFQYMINRHYYRILSKVLNKETKSALPVMDPTQGQPEPWNQWTREIIPPRIRPDDRRNLRLQREDDRQRVLAKQHEEDRQKEEERDRIRKERAEREKPGAAEFAAALATARQKDEEDKLYLQDMLKNEHQLRKDQEREASDEIGRLQDEVEELKKLLRNEKPKPSPRPSVISHGSGYSNYVPPPPPTAASSQLSHSGRPTAPTDDQDMTRRAMVDFMRKIAGSTNSIAHGVGEENRMLNEETRLNQAKLKEDFTEAQRRVFGRVMDANAMENLPPEERQESYKQLQDTLNDIYLERKRRENNY